MTGSIDCELDASCETVFVAPFDAYETGKANSMKVQKMSLFIFLSFAFRMKRQG
jgi:hypothetical protein